MAASSTVDAQQLRQQSLDLLRTTSSTFTGGAAASAGARQGTADEAAASENQQDPAYQPVTQPSTRRAAAQSQDDVQERMSEEVTAFIVDNHRCIILFTFCFLAVLVTMFVLFYLALMAALFHHSKPCDQPLKWYLLVVLLWGQVPGCLTEAVARRCDIYDGDVKKLLLSFIFSLPGWGLLGWGVYMIRQTKTCPKTNPSLFYPTEHYIIGQVFMAFFMFVIGIMAALGLRRFLLLLSGLIVKPGCQAAVYTLPKIEPGSIELVDDADGEVKACSVCLEELSEQGNLKRQNSSLQGGKTSVIVRTLCSHYFHEDCLANWCKNHVDCPLCREPVGEPDPAGEPEAASANLLNGGAMTEP